MLQRGLAVLLFVCFFLVSAIVFRYCGCWRSVGSLRTCVVLAMLLCSLSVCGITCAGYLFSVYAGGLSSALASSGRPGRGDGVLQSLVLTI